MVMNTMNPYVIEHLCMIRDDDNDNYSDIEDHGDADGDGDCFRRIDCPGDGYDDMTMLLAMCLVMVMDTVIVMAFGLVMYPYLPGCAVGVD